MKEQWTQVAKKSVYSCPRESSLYRRFHFENYSVELEDICIASHVLVGKSERFGRCSQLKFPLFCRSFTSPDSIVNDFFRQYKSVVRVFWPSSHFPKGWKWMIMFLWMNFPRFNREWSSVSVTLTLQRAVEMKYLRYRQNFFEGFSHFF